LTESDELREDYLALRESATSVQLATVNEDNRPEASYAPCVWFENDCYLFLSRLSSHTGNLVNNPSISLLILDDAAAAANAFARKRASLHGTARIIARDDAAFAGVLRLFHQRFGKVMEIIEPLPDFHLFRVDLQSGSFIRGFGQAYELSGTGLSQLTPVDPRN
jgi:hypothetical protein